MNVLSLFDGMSCGRIALERAGIPVTSYHACEIDKYAIKVSERNYPDIIRHGSVVDYHPDRHFDLLIGGSPCQGFSFSGNRLNFDDPRSKLFWEYHRIYKECLVINPDIKFMLENVRMDKRSEGIISDALGVHPIVINSALVSAQNRVRLYWTNIGPGYLDLVGRRMSLIPQPKDRGIVLKDIIEDGAVDREKAYCIDANYFKGGGHRALPLEGQQTDSIYPPRHPECPPKNGQDNLMKKTRMAGVSIGENGIRPFTEGGVDYRKSEPSDMNMERA